MPKRSSRRLLLPALALVLLQSAFNSFRAVHDFEAKQERLNGDIGRVISKQPLPHWRIGTDCSSYSLDCFAVAQQENKYLPYPFSFSTRKDIEETRVKQVDQWSIETIDELPGEWIEFLESREAKNVPVKDRNYLYPPTVPHDEYQRCINLTNKTTMEQLDGLLSGNSPRIIPEPETNMVAFTISDYAYVRDMLHDVFQMMDDVVGFSNKHFFLLAIDQRSAELACRYGYSVVFWKADEKNLQHTVANTKLSFSYELVKRGIDFFFTEMDVWWIRSPKPNLVDFQKRHDGTKDNIGKHFYVSGHQNNYGSTNIGVYAAKADKFTNEYFRLCLDILNEKPETHDQYVMKDIQRLFMNTYHGKDYELHKAYKPDGPPKTPKVQYPFEALMFSPHEIVADERPTTTQVTLAIHTLNAKPLQAPQGKQMKAKELGVYYGFHSDTSDANAPAAGYYDRNGEHRRYLWLDTEVRNNFFSLVNTNSYHSKQTLEWTMAILIAIARKTNRILVLPQIFNAVFDAGTYYAWAMMDYSNVTEMVDFRETNFLTNPKAWRRRNVNAGDDDFWPFESVASTALFKSVHDENKTMIYLQISDKSSIVSQKVWKSTVPEYDWLDTWMGSLSAFPGFDSAEVLLVNPDLLMDRDTSKIWFRRLKKWQKAIQEKGSKDVPPIGRMEQEVLEIYDLLGWCWDKERREGFRNTGSKITASDSCYGRGIPNTNY